MSRLEIEHVSKRFGATQALSDVSLSVVGGQVLALLGENGAGKSTLIKILAGIHQPDSGRITFDREPIHFDTPLAALQGGIVTVPQELRIVPSLSVAQNILLNQLPVQRWAGMLPRLDKAAMLARVEKLLADLRIELDPHARAGSLSFAERQLIVIARALAHRPLVLILDEPTASLEKREVDRLFSVVHRLRDHGVAIIYISHRLDEIPAVADRCAVMRDGRVVADLEGPDFPPAALAEAMTGRPMQLSAREVDPVGGVTASLPIGQQSVPLHKGEVLGLAGLLGSGTTQLLRTVFGAEGGTSSGVRQAVVQGRALVPGERAKALVMNMSIRDNIVLPHLARYSRGWRRDEKAIDRAVGTMMERLDIRPRNPRLSVGSLSGGNQQKVAFAKWLTSELQLLLLDEPTNGIDVAAKALLHDRVAEFTRAGGTVVLNSSDLLELLDLSHEVVVLRQGHVAGTMPRGADFGEARLRQLLGVG
ncbi:MAG TPA: sugar ABC transporter ATP-binding protein [Rubrivivax sp.]|nr:sugar ABC transporter ATP-binding protein [Rubrivivax sp.]